MQGEFYIVDGNRYANVGGKYTKDGLFAQTSDGIKLYSVEDDPEHCYLLDSFGDLYILEDYEADEADITGIYLEDCYYNDDELLAFVSQLRAEVSGEEDRGILDAESVYPCQVYNTPGSQSIYLCYDNIKASHNLLGYIESLEQGYAYVDLAEIQDKPLGAPGYDGRMIHPAFHELLDRFIR